MIKMQKSKKRFLLFIVMILFISLSFSVSAFSFDPIENAFMMFFNWMQKDAILFGITFIFVLILLYGLFSAGLSRVKAFQGGDKLNNSGKMIALSFSVLASTGFLFVLASSPTESMIRILKSMGLLAGIAIALLVFGISYYNFKGEHKTWPLTFVTTGLGILVFGLLMNSPEWYSFGWSFLIIGIIWFILSENHPRPDDSQSADNNQDGGRWPWHRDGDDDDSTRHTSPPQGWYPEIISIDRNTGRMHGVIRRHG